MIWRGAADLPEDLIFHVDYLGGDMPTFTLNFSRPGNQVVGQYYNFIRLGRSGYTRVMQTLRDVARGMSERIAEMGPCSVVSDGSDIPALSFTVADDEPYTAYDISDRLRYHGWQVPAYPMPDNAADVVVLRVVVREGFSRDLAEALVRDLASAVADLRSDPPSKLARRSGFSH